MNADFLLSLTTHTLNHCLEASVCTDEIANFRIVFLSFHSLGRKFLLFIAPKGIKLCSERDGWQIILPFGFVNPSAKKKKQYFLKDRKHNTQFTD